MNEQNQCIRIKNFEHFQHFKYRDPIWIKLYVKLLEDIEWHALDPLDNKVLVMLWLIGAEKKGRLPDVSVIAFRLRMEESRVIASVLRLSHWLIIPDDITKISGRYQNDLTELEKRRERVEREENNKNYSLAHFEAKSSGAGFEEIWCIYPRKVGKGAAIKAWEKIKMEKKPTGKQVAEAIERAKRSEQWQRENGRFIPHLATWLNQSRWLDEPPAKPPTSAEKFLMRGKLKAGGV